MDHHARLFFGAPPLAPSLGPSPPFKHSRCLTDPAAPPSWTHAHSHGEPFDLAKHPQGTEIKAITYSAMQIHTDRPKNDVYVIVDI